MNQALYAHMNNKRKMKKRKKCTTNTTYLGLWVSKYSHKLCFPGHINILGLLITVISYLKVVYF
jgi:hypothetical protein